MRIALNIGMHTSPALGKGTDILSMGRICAVLREHGFEPRIAETRQSVTEPTACIVADVIWPWPQDDKLALVALELEQEAIAVVPLVWAYAAAGWVYDWDKGALHGPLATAWGDFDRSHFLPIQL